VQVVTAMSGQWRVLLVEDDEALNANIINSLRKDGYIAQSATSVAEAMRMLWAEEYDVVMCDLQTPDVDSLELVQWICAYRPNLRIIVVGPAGSPEARSQALEGGATGYLERPLSLYALKEELRRLLQQTGFSANLDSFDLLDVIQIINMSRKSIALLVSVGLEERGMLGFREGEMIYAEYGLLRGEEAFFALAAHKNGTVVHQSWNEQTAPNVAQPLARLILQALQYRSRFAHREQMSGKQAAIGTGEMLASVNEEDDRPFKVLREQSGSGHPFEIAAHAQPTVNGVQESNGTSNATEPVESVKEWWQQTGKIGTINLAPGTTHAAPISQAPLTAHLSSSTEGTLGSQSRPLNGMGGTSATPSKATGSRRDLPSWLTDQPTSADMSAVRPSSLSGTVHTPAVPLRRTAPASAEWRGPATNRRTTGPIARKEVRGQSSVTPSPVGRVTAHLTNKQRVSRPSASPEWNPSSPAQPDSLQSLAISPRNSETLPNTVADDNEAHTTLSTASGQHAIQQSYNYAALVVALQALSYSIMGFIAAAVVTLDGRPIAQVAVDDLDVSCICKHFSVIHKSVLQSLEQEVWGEYEGTVITTADRHILMSLVGKEKNAFQVLITTRESDPIESLNVMANIESAITAVL
jgi:CheY-like chemotaxis protein/predicted regulator of Ras-like GTPase activity (Roadblock/LC7/MglB family)